MDNRKIQMKTPEQKEAHRLANIKYRQNTRTQEQKERQYAMSKAWRANRTEEQKEAHRAKRREQHNQLTPEEKEAKATYERNKRENMTDEQRLEKNEKRREEYNNRTEEQKEKQRLNNKNSKLRRTPEQKAEQRVKRSKNDSLRYKTDPAFRVGANVRSRIINAIKRADTVKSNKTLKLVGCTAKELKTYLEAKFTKGMTWDNYGKGNDKWNIDHIKPCSSFDLTNEEEQKKCFHYTNLQPLWSVINCHAKNDAVDWDPKEAEELLKVIEARFE